MIDLRAIAQGFMQRAISASLHNVENALDARVITAVHSKERPNREIDLLIWLQRYAALQGFTKDDRRTVVRSVLEFADNRGCHLDEMTRASVLVEFDALHTSARKDMRRTTKDKARDLTSLTSKALWCCYPNAVPVYDAFAQNALYVLSRLAGITPEASGDRYARFSDVWFTIYGHIKPVIDQADLCGYPYKVRVFDRMLWILGTPNYSR